MYLDLLWHPTNVYEAALNLRLFCFSDASHNSLVNDGSIECFLILIGCARARNGEILCTGNILDGGAKKITRTCKSSLSAEAIGLANLSDLAVWTRVLCLELLTGQLFKELVLPDASYRLPTPFGIPPMAEQISAELQRHDVPDDKSDGCLHEREQKVDRNTLSELLI